MSPQISVNIFVQIKDPKPWHDELVHWCHGAAGTVPLLARAYLVWRDEAHMAALVR